MKKALSLLLALIILMSAFMGLGFTASAADEDTLVVTVGDTTTNVKVGDTFRYTMALTDLKIVNCQARVDYDGSLLAVTSVDETDEEALSAYMQETFPIIYDTTVFNTELDNYILYNCSRVAQYRFTGEQTLATFEFTALAAGETTIKTSIIEMAESISSFFVDLQGDESVLIKEYTSRDYVTYEPEEEPSSEEPSSEEPSSEEPSSEEPSSEAPQNPVKVENIAATPTSSNAVLTWDAIEGATKYWVYKYKDGSYQAYCSSATNTATVGSLVGNTTYQVKVVAVLADGTMQKLADADVVEFTTLEPVVVDNINTVSDITSIKLSWEAVEGAQKYWIYKGFEEGGPLYAYDSTTDLEYNVRKLQPDSTYYFKVVPAILSNGNLALGEKDAAQMITATTNVGDSITVDITNTTSTSATLTWQPYENAIKYWVIYSTETKSTSDLSKWTTYTAVEDTTYTITGREPGKHYHFSVVALYTDSETGTEETVNYLADSARMPVSDDDIITFTAVDEDTVTLTWDDYGMEKIWVSYIDADGNETVYASTTENTMTITRSNYQNYKFALNALDSAGNVGYITRFGGEAYHE